MDVGFIIQDVAEHHCSKGTTHGVVAAQQPSSCPAILYRGFLYTLAATPDSWSHFYSESLNVNPPEACIASVFITYRPFS